MVLLSLTNMAKKKLGAIAPVVGPVVEETIEPTEEIIEPVKKAKKEKTIGGSVILSEDKIEGRYYIKTIDGLSFILSPEEYNEQVS